MNWVAVFNRLWRLMDDHGPTYFGGPRFLNAIREVREDLPPYAAFMEARRLSGRSTTRRDYFYDLLNDLDEASRWRAINVLLREVEQDAPEAVAEIRGMMGGRVRGPEANVPPDVWNADRLNDYLDQIEEAITAQNYERAVTLSYTSLEGFYKAFYRAKTVNQEPPNEIVDLSRWIRGWLRDNVGECPEETLNMINHITHAVDRARNRFGDAHFAGEAGRWLAIYVRDLVVIQTRLLLHFI
jgi:hypothetical protein